MTTNVDTKLKELKVNRNLLDSNFEGYKLSLDPLQVQTTKLATGVHRCRPSDSQWTLAHVHIFATHNDLIKDASTNSFYFFLNDGSLCQLILSKDNKKCDSVTIVFNVKFPEDISNRGDKYNATLSLPSPNFAVLSDGCGTLCLCDRSTANWKILYCTSELCDRAAFVILDSVVNSDSKIVDCLLEFVEETSDASGDDRKPSHATSLVWVTLQTENGVDWWLRTTRKLQTGGVVEYAALSRETSAVCVIGTKSVRFVFDSDKPITLPSDYCSTDNQTGETKQFDGGEWNEERGANGATTTDDDDNKSELISDPTDYQGEKMELTEPSANPEQLEECDSTGDEDLLLTWLDAETHEIMFQADLAGRQWLFSASLNAGEMPYVCLRHDVDGIVWRVPNNPFQSAEPCGSHFATFNAFGYVLAGKESRKFASCAPDCSYAAITDCRKHAYIYRNQTALETSLRNRKTGRQVSHISKQQLVSLNDNEDVVGLAALRECLLLLTETNVHVVHVGSVQEM